jgi:hypothetical protein
VIPVFLSLVRFIEGTCSETGHSFIVIEQLGFLPNGFPVAAGYDQPGGIQNLQFSDLGHTVGLHPDDLTFGYSLEHQGGPRATTFP